MTNATYFLAGRMRERFRLYTRPWPRIQAAPTDEDALNVTYRGEPKMSLKEAAKARFAGLPSGVGIDCDPCVSVCTTGVDIRLGRQPGCIGCGLRIDARDAMVAKVKRPIRRISYGVDESLRRRQCGEAAVYRPIRPRALGYAGPIALLGAPMLYQLTSRRHPGLAILHGRAPMFTTTRDGAEPNGDSLKLANKWGEARRFAIFRERRRDASLDSVGAATAPGGLLVVGDDPDSTREVELLLTAPRVVLGGHSTSLSVRAAENIGVESALASDHFFGL